MNDWKRVEEVFLEVVELEPDERPARLRLLCADHPELQEEVLSLLASDDDQGKAIEFAVRNEAARMLDDPLAPGERVGIYRIESLLGHGGMGAVYLASRDDQIFKKRVAIKIVKRGMDTAEVLARFRHERQILANLEHPYIARLFDGGSTADGLPFFVMEYIEGEPVHLFCAQRGATYREKCELFLLILEAVAYAHRNLVVHRDLKPANILITAEGLPKLLDFGVAAILGGAGGQLTQTVSARPYTPNYASPEQVRGLNLTTATDIYSLGVILYELLTGERAQKVESQSPSEIERIVCRTEPERPTRQAPNLPSELEDIVLMALRKEPERRYGSAVEFAEDIRRFLEGRPVHARQDSALYRVRKFWQRNRLETTLVALLSGSLVAGLLISLAQTRRAERAQHTAEAQRLIAERETRAAQVAREDEARQTAIAREQRTAADQQRHLAEQQRAIAEERVKDMVNLSDRAFFDIHDAVAELPGSMEARRTIVKTTLDYLEHLRKQQGMDDEMRMVLSGGYYKIGMIQGDPDGASLQDFQAAEQSLREGDSILAPAYRRHPEDLGMMRRRVEIHAGLARLFFHSRRESEAIQYDSELLPIAHRMSQMKGCTGKCLTAEADLENELALMSMPLDTHKAVDHALRGMALLRDLLKEHPDDPDLEQALGSVSAAAAGALHSIGDLERSAELYKESIAAREKLLAQRPHNTLIRRNLMIAYGNLAVVLGIPWSPNLNRPEEARIYARKCAALAREISGADPKDATARHDLGMSLGRLGMIDPGPGGAAESLATLKEAFALVDESAKENPKSAVAVSHSAIILEYEGRRLEMLGQEREAMAAYSASRNKLQPFLDAPTQAIISEYLADVECMTRMESAHREFEAALKEAEDALHRTQHYAASNPHNENRIALLGRAWGFLSLAQEAAGMRQQATGSARESLKAWDSIPNPPSFIHFQWLVERMRRIAARSSE